MERATKVFSQRISSSFGFHSSGSTSTSKSADEKCSMKISKKSETKKRNGLATPSTPEVKPNSFLVSPENGTTHHHWNRSSTEQGNGPTTKININIETGAAAGSIRRRQEIECINSSDDDKRRIVENGDDSEFVGENKDVKSNSSSSGKVQSSVNGVFERVSRSVFGVTVTGSSGNSKSTTGSMKNGKNSCRLKKDKCNDDSVNNVRSRKVSSHNDVYSHNNHLPKDLGVGVNNLDSSQLQFQHTATILSGTLTEKPRINKFNGGRRRINSPLLPVQIPIVPTLKHNKKRDDTTTMTTTTTTSDSNAKCDDSLMNSLLTELSTESANVIQNKSIDQRRLKMTSSSATSSSSSSSSSSLSSSEESIITYPYSLMNASDRDKAGGRKYSAYCERTSPLLPPPLHGGESALGNFRRASSSNVHHYGGGRGNICSNDVDQSWSVKRAVRNKYKDYLQKYRRFVSWEELWSCKSFLDNFIQNCFYNITPEDVQSMLYVNKTCRDVLYSNHNLWRSVRGGINYRSLRHIKRSNSHFDVNSTAMLILNSFIYRKIDSIVLTSLSDDDVNQILTCKQPDHNDLILINSLSIRDSNVTDSSIEKLFTLFKKVANIQLIGCNELSEVGLSSTLPKTLLSITIKDCINAADDFVGQISQSFNNLNHLHLQSYHMTDVGLGYFSGCQKFKLHSFKLESCREITNHGLVDIVSCLPNLVHLSLTGCSKINDEGIEIIAENMRKLKSLDISQCTQITDSALEYIACDLNELETLNLDKCIQISDIGIGYITTMICLKQLTMRYCPFIQDISVQQCCGMKNLKFISVAGCSMISPSGLCQFINSTSLSQIELTNCANSSPELIQYLTNHLPYTNVIY